MSLLAGQLAFVLFELQTKTCPQLGHGAWSVLIRPTSTPHAPPPTPFPPPPPPLSFLVCFLCCVFRFYFSPPPPPHFLALLPCPTYTYPLHNCGVGPREVRVAEMGTMLFRLGDMSEQQGRWSLDRQMAGWNSRSVSELFASLFRGIRIVHALSV